MASHVDSHSINKTTMDSEDRYANVGRKRIVVAPSTGKHIPSTLDLAVEEQRIPSTEELFSECKCLLGVHLIALRKAEDSTKAIQAIMQAVRACATIKQIETLENISEDMLKNMSNDDLVKYANNLLDKIKN
jgi:hypothetical protein